MKNKLLPLLIMCSCFAQPLLAQTAKLATPSARQNKWADMEYYLFVHFGPNTFTGLEWGRGSENEEVFRPDSLDCMQWCRIAKEAGAKGIIITAKHHDGFCLWPSNYSTHTVRESSWRNGKGDVLKELSDACRTSGLKMGIYLSPWDRNHPKYGTDEYNDVFVNMMKEVVSRYGPFFEFWWDGANGEGPNGKKQVYDWNKFQNVIRSIAPSTCVFSDIGPDIRWVGNEQGIAGTTNWNTLDTAGFSRGAGAPAQDTLTTGNRYGAAWLPAECDVSIRPGWFYHETEDSLVKTPEQLFNLYLKSAGRGAAFLLNVPPDTRGLFTAYDSASLVQFKKLRDENFSDNLLKNAFLTLAGNKKAFPLPGGNVSSRQNLQVNESISINIPFATKLNCILLKEYLQSGQHVAKFHINFYHDDKLVNTLTGTTIGRKRILSFPSLTTNRIEIVIDESNGNTASLSGVEGYKIAESLIER